MGASGSGKTTLLNCISTIDRATSGHIYVANEDITKSVSYTHLKVLAIIDLIATIIELLGAVADIYKFNIRSRKKT